MTGWMPFRDLPVQARFRWVYNPYFNPRTSDGVFTKVSARWFVDAQGRRFTTGPTSAVQPCSESV